jgi:SagB-type dehydrogenase family enzyme
MSGEQPHRRVRRAPDLLCTWHQAGRQVQSARRGSAVPASGLVLDVLDRLGEWTEVAALAAALDLPGSALEVLLEGLLAHALIEEEPSASPELMPSPWATWSPAAYLFHLATRDVAFARRTAAAAAPDPGPRPSAVLPRPRGIAIALPAPVLADQSLGTALRDRRTHRRFAADPIDVQALGTLLGVTFGVQAWAHAGEGPLALKTSPSGGARHSLEAYVWARHVTDVPAGLYHYRGDDHALSRIADEPAPALVSRWLPTQTGYDGTAVVVVMASVLARVAWRYRSARAYRVVLIETGHLAQTFCLAATALQLAPFCTAALADSVIESDLGLDHAHQPVLYVVGAGTLAPGAWQPHEGRPAPRLELTPLGRAWPASITDRRE